MQRLYRCTHKSWFHHPSVTKKPLFCSPNTLCVSQKITIRSLQSFLLLSTRPWRFRPTTSEACLGPLLNQYITHTCALSRHPLINRSRFPIEPCDRHCIARLRLLQEQVLKTQRHIHQKTSVHACTYPWSSCFGFSNSTTQVIIIII